ncbi:MAG: SUF system NifU family Fe-S cluster assembly protein [Chloroflexi bacterium]|nr:SUF system NifU family Fe-S cluster assembly protein [Chloroflexota bacterium]
MALDDLDELYRDSILEHSRNPRHREQIEDPDLTAVRANRFCGDEVHLQIALDDSGRIVRIGLQGVGCAITQASGSMMADALRGKTLGEADELSEAFRGMMQGRDNPVESPLDALAGVRQVPIRIKCALLSWSTLDDGIKKHRKRK